MPARRQGDAEAEAEHGIALELGRFQAVIHLDVLRPDDLATAKECGQRQFSRLMTEGRKTEDDIDGCDLPPIHSIVVVTSRSATRRPRD